MITYSGYDNSGYDIDLDNKRSIVIMCIQNACWVGIVKLLQQIMYVSISIMKNKQTKDNKCICQNVKYDCDVKI